MAEFMGAWQQEAAGFEMGASKCSSLAFSNSILSLGDGYGGMPDDMEVRGQ